MGMGNIDWSESDRNEIKSNLLYEGERDRYKDGMFPHLREGNHREVCSHIWLQDTSMATAQKTVPVQIWQSLNELASPLLEKKVNQ